VNVQPGHLYTHARSGGTYLIVALAQNSTNDYPDKEDLVVYFSLTKGLLWVRRLSEFNEWVSDSLGYPTHRRFEHLGPAPWYMRLALRIARHAGVLPLV